MSKYKVIQGENSFSVEAEGMGKVFVTLEDYRISVAREDVFTHFSLVRFVPILENIAWKLTWNWKRPEKYANQHMNYDVIRKWALQRTQWAIAARAKEQWKRLIEKVDPRVYEVQKRLFASTFNTSPYTAAPELYEEKEICDDLIKYPAACHALINIDELLYLHGSRILQEEYELWKQSDKTKKILNAYGARPSFYVNRSNFSIGAVIDGMGIWRDLLSPDMQSYRSLDRTLMNYPGKMSSSVMMAFPRIRLSRPVTDRLCLISLLSYAMRMGDMGNEDQRNNVACYMHATRDQILRAWDLYTKHHEYKLNIHKTDHIFQMSSFTADYPHHHAGNLVGLVKKSIEWHQDERRRRIDERVRGYENVEIVKPLIPPPDMEEVKFLDTPMAIAEEGQDMGHCVSNYIPRAAKGKCFLFAIDFNGERATAEVSAEGKVIQSKGPHNRENEAATWGARVLSEWGNRFPRSEDGRVLLPAAANEDIRFDEPLPF